MNNIIIWLVFKYKVWHII